MLELFFASPFALFRPQEGDARPDLPQDGPGGPGLEAGGWSSEGMVVWGGQGMPSRLLL